MSVPLALGKLEVDADETLDKLEKGDVMVHTKRGREGRRRWVAVAVLLNGQGFAETFFFLYIVG